MKFKILSESPNRIRVQVLQNSMSFEQADTLFYYVRHIKGVTFAKVTDRTCTITIKFTGDKWDIVDALQRFNYEMFKKFKPGAILLNMARGSIVDTEGLLKALDEGILSGAGIDTYEYEMPYIQKDYQDKAIEDEVFARLVHHPRVMYSPHIAYFTDEAIKNLVEGALNAAVEVITTGTSKSRVN